MFSISVSISTPSPFHRLYFPHLLSLGADCARPADLPPPRQDESAPSIWNSTRWTRLTSTGRNKSEGKKNIPTQGDDHAAHHAHCSSQRRYAVQVPAASATRADHSASSHISGCAGFAVLVGGGRLCCRQKKVQK